MQIREVLAEESWFFLLRQFALSRYSGQLVQFGEEEFTGHFISHRPRLIVQVTTLIPPRHLNDRQLRMRMKVGKIRVED